MAGPTAVDVVTVHVWRLPARQVPRTVGALATDQQRIRRMPGVAFAKVLGTSRPGRFALRDADVRRWALITSWSDVEAARGFDRSPVVAGWNRRAAETWTATFRPLSAHGRWSRCPAFGRPARATWTGPVAAITRARIRLVRLPTFWRAVPGVNADLVRRPGLCFALGIGEAPVGVQGTLSVWRDDAALRGFAFDGAAHRSVIAEAAEGDWFAEAMFARFALVDARGTVDGVDPMAGRL
jgi:hypothetical protein